MSYTLFNHKRNEGILEELRAGISISWQENKKKQIKLAGTCNKNEQQDAKIRLNYRSHEDNLEDL